MEIMNKYKIVLVFKKFYSQKYTVIKNNIYVKGNMYTCTNTEQGRFPLFSQYKHRPYRIFLENLLDLFRKMMFAKF